MFRDFLEIDIEKVRIENIDPNWKDTPHLYSREEIEKFIENLREIQKICREKKYTVRDFEKMQYSPNPKERELYITYKKFYTLDSPVCITVVWGGDHYEIENGRYRLWMAREKGLKHVPALVYAKDRETIQRLREEGERISRGEQSERDFPFERNIRIDRERER